MPAIIIRNVTLKRFESDIFTSLLSVSISMVNFESILPVELLLKYS